MTDMVMMPGANYQAICDAVREKTGGTALLKSGELAALIGGISGGEEAVEVPSLNGRRVASGSISVAEDTDNLGTIIHDIVDPIAVFLFAETPKIKNSEDAYIQQIVGKVWIKPNPLLEGNAKMSFSILRGGSGDYMQYGSAASANAYRFSVDIAGKSFSPTTVSYYPFVAGTVYHWIVIGEEV